MLNNIYQYTFTLIVLLLLPYVSISQSDNTSEEEKVYSICDNALKNQTSNLNLDSLGSLPIGIVKDIGSTRYIIAVDSARYWPGTPLLSSYMAIAFPGTKKRLAFAAKNIPFNTKGIMPGNGSRLMLVSPVSVNISAQLTIKLLPDGRNYVEWGCDGFKAIHLHGVFEFNSSMLIPDSASNPQARVSAEFDVHLNDIHQFITDVSLSPFKISGLNDVRFSARHVVVDLSEIQNSPNMVFPAGYKLADPSSPMEWTGFYVQDLDIRLPFSFAQNDKKTEISTHNFIIDGQGLSGTFEATNLFDLKEGNIKGWGFSVDRVAMNFAANTLNGGALAGLIQLPISETSSLKYTASIFQNNETHESDFSFTISPGSQLDFNAFAAKIELNPSSAINITKKGSQVLPAALLNGKISFSNSTMDIASLTFQDMLIESDVPYIKQAFFSLNTNGKHAIGTVPVTLNNISFGYNIQNPVMSFDLGINFMESKDVSFSSNVDVKILTLVKTLPPETPNGSPKKKLIYDNIVIGEIGISMHVNAFELDGKLRFKNNDPIYGNGFFGSVKLKFEPILGEGTAVNMWFGSKNDFRYYYIDGKVPVNIPIGYGLALRRFMGGVYYHMTLPGAAQLATVLSNGSTTDNAGKYIPDANTGLGIKAGVTVASDGSDKTFNGDLLLDIAFNNNWGINTISLSGEACMMMSIAEREKKSIKAAPVYGSMVMIYDNVNSSFHALLNAHISYNGVTADGQIVAHFDPAVWYVLLGKPSNRINVNVNGLVNLSAYFMTGNRIEPMPPPYDAAVRDMAINRGLYNPNAGERNVSSSGFAFGAYLSAGTSGEFDFDVVGVYWNVYAGIGFDFNLNTNSGNCGLNGMYARGNLYARVSANVGGKYWFFGTQYVNILNADIIGILGGGMPNPYYANGALDCHVSVCDIIDASFSIGFTLGSGC